MQAPQQMTRSSQTKEAAKRLLFVVNEPGEFVELARVAAMVQPRGYEVAFLFAQPGYINLRQDRAICEEQGYAVFYPGMARRDERRLAAVSRREAPLQSGYRPYSLTISDPSRRRASRLKLLMALTALAPLMLLKRVGLLRDKHVDPYAESAASRFVYLRTFLYARHVYRAVKPALVVYGQEFPGSPNALITRCCQQDGVPTLIIPFAVGTTREMVESLHDKPAHFVQNGLMNNVAAKLFPAWVNYYKGRELLRLPGQTVLILEFLHLAPPHPWLPNSSDVNKIAVESEQMLSYYRGMEFPEKQLALTGAVYDDHLFKAKQAAKESREKLAAQLRIDPSKKWLVCAWPTDQFGSRKGPLEFDSYEQLCHAWATALADVVEFTDYEVVICPHPVTNRGMLREVLTPYGLQRRVTRAGTLNVVCCADIFVACVSSTIRWAISLGVPVINYDCYEYGYIDFDSAGGVRTVSKFVEFERQLRAWTDSAQAYERARAEQLADASKWGWHDGQSQTRLAALIDQLVTMQLPNPSTAPTGPQGAVTR